ncbi:Uncharacterized protein APZ42_009938, partial [Daphnia magna]
ECSTSRQNQSNRIEAIHIAVSRVNCFDVRHFLWLFMSCFALSVLAESVISQYKADFVNQCLIFFNFFFSVNCYVS